MSVQPDTGSKILFVFHEASRSGAPNVLIGLLKELRRSYGMTIRILVMEEGPLMDELRAIGDTYVWKFNRHDAFFARLRRLGVVLKRQYVRRQVRMFDAAVRDAKLVFLNTIANGKIQDHLRCIGCPMITYVHELESSIRMVSGPQALRTVVNHTDFFLAASGAVQTNLVKTHGVPLEKVRVFYPSLQLPLANPEVVESLSFRFRSGHGIPSDCILVGLASSAEWRKGFDWFFPLVQYFFRMYPDAPVRFVWKGYWGDDRGRYFDLFDFRKTGLEDRVLLIQHDAESLACIAALDIHLLLSREDPYPLVMLEAASLGIPTVSFDDAGGSAEFIGRDAGITVPYGNFHEMAIAIHRLAEDAGLRRSMGERARDRVHARHDVRDAVKEMKLILDRWAGSGNAADRGRNARQESLLEN
jgi:glycosyltransferase involved in cell wall biosynthesis